MSYDGKPAESFGFKLIKYEKRDLTATITFNRPKVHNAVNGAMLLELNTAFQDAAWDDDVRVVVLTGAGDKAFCTGADVKEQAEEFVGKPNQYWKWMGLFIECHERLRNIGKPTIARLNGMVVGGGNEFNLSCDLAIAADDIIIKQVGAARGSVAAAGATQFLPLLVGDRRAREILFLCEDIPAAKALEWGLVNQVVPRTQLDAAVDAMATKLINKLPVCLRYAKEQLNFWRNLSWHLTIGHAKEFLALNNLSPEVEEGMRAFVEKRPVDYEKARRKIE
ncbi:MAG TPA: enoyl-CoA hydratase/isomerase family protein [Phycisphaerae bacterium]|nr:enoyl-CoA hydratase/isomerase family protein [Phycisphaerae bacterium]